jgi:uroporphyrinogen decarboxylase
MTRRERTIAAISHREPDRPPLYLSLTPQVALMLSEHLGLPYEEPEDAMESARISHPGLLSALGADILAIAPAAPHDAPTLTLPDGRIRNEWGMTFRTSGLYSEFAEYPLSMCESTQEIVEYPLPDPGAPGRFDAATRAMTRYGNSHGIIGDIETMFFELSWYLTGMEKFLTDLMGEREYLLLLMDRIMEYIISCGCRLIGMGVDILWCGDDFGTQSSLLIDPETWRKIVKPRIARMFSVFRNKKPDIRIAWHSCGSIVPIIPDFIELGLDILNPIQPLAEGMDPSFLKKEFGKDLAFFGGIDVQHLLPFGTPSMIRDEVRRRIDILGKDGGYIIAPAHNIQADTPVENVLAFTESVCQY